MAGKEEQGKPKQKDFGTISFCAAGAGVWWFLCSEPSTVTLMLAAIALLYLFLAYCLLAVLLPESAGEGKKEGFVPLPQSDVERPKALSYQ